MKVLVIPEDFRKDQYILKPNVEALMSYVGHPHAVVRVLTDPLLGGISQALNRDRLQEILARYQGMTDLFLLCVDRDGQAGRRRSLDAIEEFAEGLLPKGRLFLAENAWQELEVWVLAGHDLPGWQWTEIREEVNPKEIYFEPYARQRGLTMEPGGGRKTLAQEAARRYGRLRQLCKEDLKALEAKVQQRLER